MAEPSEVIQPAEQWISNILMSCICVATNAIILKYELKHRKQSMTSDRSSIKKSFQIFSSLCIASGIIFGVFWFLSNMDGFCIFSEWMAISCMTLQALFMGFYQLSRLYYCFSNDKIHSNKGYPKCLFLIMYTTGIIIGLINILPSDSLRANCGINSKSLTYHYEQYPVNILQKLDSTTLAKMTAVVWALWDLLTLFLYLVKMISFRRYKTSQPKIYRRITSILFKIFILTVFYEITTIMSIVLMVYDGLFVISQLGRLLYSSSFSFAMFLMMDYNKEQYKIFLNCVYCMKCNYMCCCWKEIVIDQIQELSEDTAMLEMSDQDRGRPEKSEITVTEMTQGPTITHGTANSERSVDMIADGTAE